MTVPMVPPSTGHSARRLHDQRALDALYETGKILSGPAEPDRMLSPVLNVLSSFMDLHHGAVALLVKPEHRLDAETVNPYVIAATSLREAPQPPDCGAVPPSVARTVLRTGVAMVIQNVAAELGPEALPPGLPRDARVALIAAPIREHGQSPLVTGVVAAFRDLDDQIPVALDQDLRLLTMVANLLAQSLRFRRMVARDRERLMAEAQRAAEALEDAAGAREATDALDIIGDSAAIREVVARIRKVAPTRATVLLRGESGTGKELFARAVHRLSERRYKPFVKVNCAALSETLLESELFGHEKGAFTGAVAQKKGRFELADGGTLFLDEIGEIGPAFQAKLLRALQEGEFERVGGTRTVKVDVRLVAATNRDLEEAVARGEFRADLYFRICVIPIVLPPLRNRPEDIPRLAETFLDRLNRENGSRLRFDRASLGVLQRCYFPGNVRELENCVNRVAALASGPVIGPDDLACHQDACLSAQLWRLQAEAHAPVGGLGPIPLPVLGGRPAALRPAPPPEPVEAPRRGELAGEGAEEKARLVEAMERSGWVQAKAARILGITPRQIGYALRKHGIEIRRL